MLKAIRDLLATRRQRGMVCTSVTCLEDCLDALKPKDILTSTDPLTVECLLKKIEALEAEFKEHH